MAELYLRECVLTIDAPNAPVKRISGLRITFDIEKTNESSPNLATIGVYNLAESTRSILEQGRAIITLECGYQGTTERVFVGNLDKVVHVKDGPEIISTMELADGGNRYRNARTDRAFPPNVTNRQVYNALATDMGLNQAVILGVPQKIYAHGLSLSGHSRHHLDELTRRDKMEWSIQDNSLQIIPSTLPTSDASIFLNSDTGLIGSPNKTKEGVEFESLLQPRIRPGRQVELDSKFIKGKYKVRKVNHRGDSQGGDFVTSCEAT